MKLITKDTDYAVRALIFMAKNDGRLFSVTELSRRLRIPGPFLRLILQTLNKKGILASYRGKGGGFRIALPGHKVFVADLIRIFQGPIKFDSCLIKKELCPDIKSCSLKRKIRDIGSYVNKEFKSITINSLLSEKV